MSNETLIPAGTMLTFDHGEYSDFRYTGPFKVEKEIAKYELAAEYRKQWKPKDDWDDEPDYDGFIIWLHRGGYISDVESTSWHIGSYGRFEP